MKWVIDYFEQEDTTQPAEVFEDALDHTYPKLSGKLLRVVSALRLYGHQLGGGYLEKCHDYEGLWEFELFIVERLHVSFLALMETVLSCFMGISSGLVKQLQRVI